MDADREYMQRALTLAEQGRGRTSPNPMVGCVIVRGGRIIGEGYHARAGQPHAEVNACAAAHDDIAEATVYVTLEPCSHTGKTPPCADFLIARKPSRVVAAMMDPNPLVAGKGIARLREAGIAVEAGLLEAEAKRLNEAFIKYITTRRPFVIAKCGMTLDGKIATRTGHSQWVTCEASRRMVHQLRNEVDGIMVGSRTMMFDNPSLTVRLEGEETRDPVRIILDAEEYLDGNRRVFQINSASTWVAVTKDRDYSFAAEVIRVPEGPGGVSMPHLMEELGNRGITSLLIEGGGATLASAFEAGVVDKAWFFIAPKIVGGRDAITPVEGNGVATMNEAVLLERMQVKKIDQDILVEAYVKK